MNQEDKDLLFVDLCARLPYHVKVKVWLEDGDTEEGFLDLEYNYADVLLDAFYYNKIKKIKPYLRPMSSMTEEEKIESLDFAWEDDYGRLASYNENIPKYINWLNAHHFDYRGLIERGLAIEVTEENNPYKK